MKRIATESRKTSETMIKITVNLDGTGKHNIQTPTPFFSHMLELLSYHSLMDLDVSAQGLSVHHVVEDVGLTLGTTIDKALKQRAGIRRYGFAKIPMDETAAEVIVDLSGRPYFQYDASFSSLSIEDLPTELIKHFFESLTQTIKANIHLKLLYGENDHHRAEALFKALARALRQAVELDPRRKDIPSTKGTL